MCIHCRILMLFIMDAGVVVAKDVPPTACIKNINITQDIYICVCVLFNDKECFNHRVTTKIYSILVYSTVVPFTFFQPWSKYTVF